LELASFRRKSSAYRRLFYLGLQAGKGRVALNSRPKRRDHSLAFRKEAETGKGQLESLDVDLCQGIINIPGEPIVHLSQKAKGQMKVFRLDPAGARNTSGDGRQSVTDFVRQAESDEKAHNSTLQQKFKNPTASLAGGSDPSMSGSFRQSTCLPAWPV